MRFLAVLALLLVAGGVAAARKRCAALCRNEIAACRAAVPANGTCPPGHGHQRCIGQLQKQRARCKPDTLRQCHQNPDPGTCTSATTTTVPGGATTTTVPGAVCDLNQVRCTGTVRGVVSGQFDCTNTFSHFNATTGQTLLTLSVPTAPIGVDTIGLWLNFDQMPAAPKTYEFPSMPGAGTFLPTSFAAVYLPSGHLFPTGYIASPSQNNAAAPCGWCPAGTMTLVLSSAVERPPPGTPGDWCLHGTFDATTVSGAGATETVHADF